MMEKEERHKAAVQRPYTTMLIMTSRVKIPCFICGGRSIISSVAISMPRPMSGIPEGYYNNPEDFDWGKQENRLAILIFESQTSKECTHLCDILGEQIQHKFLDVVKNTAAFFHNFKDRGKIIICQNNIRGIFGDIEPAWLIAIPTSTCLSKGESFTPLPVMAANSPRQ